MPKDERGQALDDVAVLAEPVRRSLYAYVSRSHREVGRDEAAKALRLDRALAAFHLDKLVEAGFLDVTYRRLSGRVGPGAGRPAKLYRRTAKEIELSLPPRRYELLARLLVRAVRRGGVAAKRELAAGAAELGAVLADQARAAAGARPDRKRLLDAAERTLEAQGFEPRHEDDGSIRMANCPFHAVASESGDVVCAMNRELLGGFVKSLDLPGLRAELDPRPGVCCVSLRVRTHSSGAVAE